MSNAPGPPSGYDPYHQGGQGGQGGYQGGYQGGQQPPGGYPQSGSYVPPTSLPVPQPGWTQDGYGPQGSHGPQGPQKKPRPSWVMPVGVLVVVAAIGGIGFALMGGDDEKDSTTARAARNIAAATEQFDLTRTDEPVELESCEGFDLDAVAEVAPREIDADEAADGTTGGYAFQPASSRDPVMLQCVAADTTTGAFFYVVAGLAPSGDFEEYLERQQVTSDAIEDTSTFAGGTMHPICGAAADTTTQICETFWVNSDIQVGVASSGDGLDADTVTEWLQDALNGILAELAALDPAEVTEA